MSEHVIDETLEIEGGTFLMGSSGAEIERIVQIFGPAYHEHSLEDFRSWLLKQYPQHEVSVKTFRLGQKLVTNAAFAEYELEVHGNTRISIQNRPNYPVIGVPFFDACAYCQWLSSSVGRKVRLPTEEEWEFAASSRGKFRFPWGNEFSSNKANSKESKLGEVTTADEFAQGASEQGILDLAGNAEEWTSSMYLPYSGQEVVRDHIFYFNGGVYPVLRGGSYNHWGDLCLAARRHGLALNGSVTGFRIAVELP